MTDFVQIASKTLAACPSSPQHIQSSAGKIGCFAETEFVSAEWLDCSITYMLKCGDPCTLDPATLPSVLDLFMTVTQHYNHAVCSAVVHVHGMIPLFAFNGPETTVFWKVGLCTTALRILLLSLKQGVCQLDALQLNITSWASCSALCTVLWKYMLAKSTSSMWFQFIIRVIGIAFQLRDIHIVKQSGCQCICFATWG